MSKNWYPIINYEKCIQCGACTEKCKNGVFKANTDNPIVLYPEGCVEGCRGCQKLCPTDAIEYAGDTEEHAASSCGCSCS